MNYLRFMVSVIIASTVAEIGRIVVRENKPEIKKGWRKIKEKVKEEYKKANT